MKNEQKLDQQIVVAHTPEEFSKKYQALCEEMGYRIAVTPFFTPTNHQTYEVELRVLVEPLPRK